MKPNTLIKSYHELVHFFESLPGRGRAYHTQTEKNNRDRMHFFLRLLGNPEKNLFIIHVAGTSGKGSTCTMIQNILTSAKKKSGMYTSPHLTTTLERFTVGSRLISLEDFLYCGVKVREMIKKNKSKNLPLPTYKETMHLMSMLAFHKNRCRYAVIETGMGGRLDPTNACESDIQVITDIGHDHTKYLGKTLRKIAEHKAGIIKNNKPVFVIDQNPKLIRIIEQESEKKNASLTIVRPRNLKNFSFSKNPSVLLRRGGAQIRNASLAVAVCRSLRLPKTAIERGLSVSEIPARLEPVSKQPLIILDGAHNTDKIQNTRDFLHNLKPRPRRVFLIIAIATGKNYQHMLKSLVPYGDEIIFTCFSHKHRSSTDIMLLKKTSLPYTKTNAVIKTNSNAERALEDVLKKIKKDDMVLITGSLYLAGQLRQRWCPEHVLLAKRSARLKKF